MGYIILWSAIKPLERAANVTSLFCILGSVFALLSRYIVFFIDQGLHQGPTLSLDEEKNIDEQKIEEKEVKNSNVSREQNKIIVPSLGESISEALISKWMKSPGENVKKGEPIVELETDKVTQELYAESSGVLKEILFNEAKLLKNFDFPLLNFLQLLKY